MAQHRWQPESREAFIAEMSHATSINDLAMRLDVSVSALSRWCRDNDMDLAPVRSKGGRRPFTLTAEEWEAVDKSGGVRAIAKRLRIAADTLRDWALRSGVDLDPYRSTGHAAAPDDPKDCVDVDTAAARETGRAKHYKSLYEEALTRIRKEEDVWNAVAERFAEPRPRPVFRRRAQSTKLPPREAVLLLSDWQLGELVHAEEVGGVNAYSWAIAEKRAQRLVDAVTSSLLLQLNAFRITRLVISVLGDMVEGHDIFTGQPWSLEKDAAMQAIDGSELLAGVICAIVEAVAPHGITVDVYCVPGNHGKPGGRKAGATPVTFNFDYMLYYMLQKELRDQPVREIGVEPAGRLLFEAAGHVFLMTHGNEVRGWGGFPYYGMDKTHARLTMELETLFKFWLLGHWHAEATLPAGRGKRIVNGTMVGANQLTQAAVLTTSAPCQKLLYVSRDLGLAEEAYMVLDTEKRAAPHVWGRE